MALDGRKNEIDAAICFNKADYTCHHNRNHRDIIHALDTAAAVRALEHDGKHLLPRDCAAGYADNQREDDSRHQHNKHIQSSQCANQHHQIGQNLPEVIAQVAFYPIFAAASQYQKQYQRDNGGGQDDFQVFTEFILHVAALCPGSGNRCI